jgi:hypothetical protein
MRSASSSRLAPRRAALPLLAAACLSLAGRAAAQEAQKPAASDAPSAAPPPERDSGPSIEIAPEHQDGEGQKDKKGAKDGKSVAPFIGLGSGEAADHELVRGLIAQRFRAASESTASTAIGGYGEIHVRGTTQGKSGERAWIADIPRLVIFVAHEYSPSFRSYIELEMEHSLSCATCPGAVELEQAYIDWKIGGDYIGLRAGLVLVPMGVINQWHEPPVFHGVTRPRVETVVIPSTWREIGAGFFGQPHEILRYELYAMTGLDPAGFSANGIGGGRQNGGFAAAKGWAVTGRVEVEPMLGLVIGASGYVSDAGPNGALFDRSGAPVDLSLPVIGWSADARLRHAGIEWKVLFAEWHMPESKALMLSYSESGALRFPDATYPVPTTIRGAYVEGAYDVLRPFDVNHQLLPFARIEHYTTQADVPEGYAPSPIFSVREYTFGASYRPIQQIVLKADYQLRNRKLGYDETQINFGAGFMY